VDYERVKKMNFKIGQIVKFNNANYVVMDSQSHLIDGVAHEFLHIRDIVSNDVINVDAVQVELVDLSASNLNAGNSFDDFESSAEKAEEDLIENKTEYLNSLFSQIKAENTEEFFDLNDDTKTTNELPEQAKAPDSAQDFLLPRTYIKPRRHTEENLTAVNATFSDLDVATVIPTKDLNNTHEILKPRREFQAAREKTSEMEVNQIMPKSIITTTHEEVADPKMDDDITNLIKSDATDVSTIVEPGFSESTEDDLSITSETNNIILEGLNSKADKFKEKQREILATGPINAKKIEQYLQSDAGENDQILDDITKEILDDNEAATDALFSTNDATVALPIIGIIVKIAGNVAGNITQPMALANIFDFNLNFANSAVSLTTFVATILLLFATPLILLITVVYAMVYIVVTLKRQYRRVAYFNHKMVKDAETIESLQDFSNEASVFMIKLHNENKEMKKQIKKVTKLSGANMARSMGLTNKKEIH
jgi:ABC-type multidrug transport system fused ATPase/permease subunit